MAQESSLSLSGSHPLFFFIGSGLPAAMALSEVWTGHPGCADVSIGIVSFKPTGTSAFPGNSKPIVIRNRLPQAVALFLQADASLIDQARDVCDDLWVHVK